MEIRGNLHSLTFSSRGNLFMCQHECWTVSKFFLAVLSVSLLILPTAAQQKVNLTPELNHVEIEVLANEAIQISVSNTPAGTGYILIQAHAYLNNVTLSSSQALTPGQYTTGYNIGVVITPPAASAYLQNSHNVSVPVLLIAQFYDTNAPIPGGCNMELSIKTAPFLPTEFTTDLLTIEYPLGSWPLNVKPATCDRAPLQYDIYEYYVEERDFSSRTAFDSILLMSNLSSIEHNGRKVEFSGSPPSKVKFANYPGTGRVVAVILRTLTSSAAYTPTLSYGCHPEYADDEESCQVLTSVGAKLLNAALLFIGLFLLALGHRFYKCQLFLLGFCMSAIIFYIILGRVISVGSTVAGSSATTVGALGGALWLALWSKFGSPMAPVLLAAVLLGSLAASIVAYTPLGDITLLKDDLTFWLAYICLTLAVPLSIISFAQLTSIVVSSVLGSYLFILPIDHYVGANLKFIVLNILRRAINPDFRTALVDPPFQTKDLVLTIVWASLSIVGALFQLWRERGRAPFPRPPSPSFQQSRFYQSVPSSQLHHSQQQCQQQQGTMGEPLSGRGAITTGQQATESSYLLQTA